MSYYAIPSIVRTASPADKAAQLANLYHLGHKTLPLTYIAGGLVHFWLSWHGHGNSALRFEAIAGAITLAIVPFSIIVIEPTDRKMLSIKGDDDESVIKEVGGAQNLDALAWRWSKLNAIRSAMPLIGAIISFYTLCTA